MKLSVDQIRSVCMGSVRVEETENGVRMFRFTKAQEELYKATKTDFYIKTFASAGVRLAFETDSPSLFLKVNVTPGSSRKYFSFDVSVNGEIVDYLDNFSRVNLPRMYTTAELPFTKNQGAVK